MKDLKKFFKREDMNNIHFKIFDPLSGETNALKVIYSICKSDGTISNEKLNKKIYSIIAAHAIHRNKHTDSPIHMSLRAKARNQRRFFHLMRNFLYGNSYRSVEEKTDWNLIHTKNNFRNYFFKIFGLSFENSPKYPVWEEVNRLCNYYVPHWYNWILGKETELKEEIQINQDFS